jgi:hypothetical protein
MMVPYYVAGVLGGGDLLPFVLGVGAVGLMGLLGRSSSRPRAARRAAVALHERGVRNRVRRAGVIRPIAGSVGGARGRSLVRCMVSDRASRSHRI